MNTTMKIKLSCAPLFLLLPLLVNGQSGDTGFYISTNRFEYVVTSTNATPEERHDIAAMLVQLSSQWGDKTVEWYESLPGRGSVEYSHLNTCFIVSENSSLKVPFEFYRNSATGTYELPVDDDILLRYRNAAELMSTHSNELAAMSTFVSSLQSKPWKTATFPQLSEMFCIPEDQSDLYAAHIEEVATADLPGLGFEPPCITDFFTNADWMPERLKTNLCAMVRMHHFSGTGPGEKLTHAGIPAVWIDGRWKIVVEQW